MQRIPLNLLGSEQQRLRNRTCLSDYKVPNNKKLVRYLKTTRESEKKAYCCQILKKKKKITLLIHYTKDTVFAAA